MKKKDILNSYSKYKHNSQIQRLTRSKRKIQLISFIISLVFTIFIFPIARTNAVDIRGNEAFGGEIMLLLIPVLVLFVIENIYLQKTVRIESKRYR